MVISCKSNFHEMLLYLPNEVFVVVTSNLKSDLCYLFLQSLAHICNKQWNIYSHNDAFFRIFLFYLFKRNKGVFLYRLCPQNGMIVLKYHKYSCSTSVRLLISFLCFSLYCCFFKVERWCFGIMGSWHLLLKVWMLLINIIVCPFCAFGLKLPCVACVPKVILSYPHEVYDFGLQVCWNFWFWI